LLSAHSLPVRVIASGDPYQREFEASARAIADAVGWPARVVYQSQGDIGGEWLGPTLSDAFDAARADGVRTVVVAPVGFLADHVETLYDLDVEARAGARERGLELVRVPALNDDPALIAALVAVTLQAFEAPAPKEPA
jgi:ferrochelatase